jgi:hypothetical protein
MHLNEDSLQAGDLRDTVSHIFEVDHFRSKMGDDKDVAVLSFTVESLHPAEDLVEFIEKGYQFVLDADVSPGELKNGKYKVFVEIERNRHLSENITELLYGVGKLTGIENFKFRYYKSFNSISADELNLKETIPQDPVSYQMTIQENQEIGYDSFFNRSMFESLEVFEDNIEFKKIWAEPLKFKILNFGNKKEIIESIEDKISVSHNDMAEVMFLTKYIGNYNITKLGNKFMFENKTHALILEREQ